jgi:hypothetical protein
VKSKRGRKPKSEHKHPAHIKEEESSGDECPMLEKTAPRRQRGVDKYGGCYMLSFMIMFLVPRAIIGCL